MPSSLLSPVEIGEHLDVTAETIRRLHRSGRIPGYRVGRKLRFDLTEVREALRVASTTPAPPTPAPAGPNFDALDAA